MKKTLEKIIWILLGIVLIFLIYEVTVKKIITLHIFGEKNGLIIQTPQKQIFTFGDQNSLSLQSTLGTIMPYFQKKTISLEEQAIGKETIFHQTSVLLISENLIRGNFENHTIWFINNPEDEDFTKLKQHPINLKSDWWALTKTKYPDFLPIPTQGILFLGTQKPGQTLITFAEENKIPLITIKDTNGFLLELKDQEWKLKTRK